MEKATSDKALKNLNRVEGQIRGIAKMVGYPGPFKRQCPDAVGAFMQIIASH